MVVHILGPRTAAAQAYAIHTGIALQLTNIIRDVVSDFRRGRVYLPVEDMEQFGVSESDLGGASSGADVILFLRHQCSRARSYYALADEAYAECRSYALFPARAMQNMYSGVLTRIEADLSRVLLGRVDLRMPQKLRVLVRTWLEERSHG
jgi:phytoene synthase